MPLTKQELITEANKCLVNEDPPNPPRFDTDKFRELVGSKEVVNFLHCLSGQSDIAKTIEFLRDQFYYIEHKPHTVDGKTEYTSIVYDEHGTVHTVMKDGVVQSTKEF